MRGLTSAVHIRTEGKYRVWPHDQSQGGSRSGYFGSGRHQIIDIIANGTGLETDHVLPLTLV